MSCDRTLQVDTRSRAELQQHLRRAADQLGNRLRKRNFVAGGVRIKLKTSKFQTLSRQCALAEPSAVGQCLYAAAEQLLNRLDHPGPFRLVGMAAHNIAAPHNAQQLSLWHPHGKDAKLEQALDQLNERYGRGTIRRARDLTAKAVLSGSPNLDFVDQAEADGG